jgi:hypothetical protein
MKKLLFVAAVAAFLSAQVESSFGAAFTPGDLVVLRMGDGSAALGSTATAAFLEEYTVAGALVQTIALPTAVSGANNPLTFSGSSTSEAFLELTANGQYLTIGGYGVIPGTATPTGTGVNRVVGLVSLNGTVDTSTLISPGATSAAGNIRSVTSDDGTHFWIASSSSGVSYVAAVGGPAASATQLSSSPTNVRVVRNYNGQLYISSASGTFQGISTIGTGLPTTSGQTTTILPGFPVVSGPSNYDFFRSGNNLWVADDRTGAGGGLQHWLFDGTSWSLQYTIQRTGAGDRGLAVDNSGASPLFYVTTTDNKVDLVVDTGLLGTSTATTVFSDGTALTAFRGIAMIPAVPEPTSLSLFGGFGLLYLFLRRRK